MYRIKEIQNALLHLVGWKQSYNPAQIIDSRLTETESGLYFQEAHPLVTLDNVRSIMPDDFGFKYPDWNLIFPYKKGDKVRFRNVVWISLVDDNLNNEPAISDFNNDYNEDFGNPYWRPYNMLSDYLEELTRSGITKAIQTFIEGKTIAEQTKNLLERKTFFDGAGRLNATIPNNGKFVGFEINPTRSLGVTAKIERIGLQMTGGTGIVKLYIFHSSQITPIKTIDLNFTVANGGFQWFNLSDCFLPNSGDNTNAVGSWVIGYNQDDLPEGMQAINVSKDWSVEPCGTCNVGNIENWRELMKYVRISPFKMKAPTTFETFPEMDYSDLIYTSTYNYGMNVEISVGCDLTDFIISQRSIFQSVIQKQVAAITLRTMAMNPDVKVNRNQSNVSKMDLLYELDGNTAAERPGGLGHDLKKSFAALNLDTKGIDRVCLGCSNGGVRYKSI